MLTGTPEHPLRLAGGGVRRRGVFVARKLRLAADLFRLGWGLRIPFVSRDVQAAARHRLLDLKASKAGRLLRRLRTEARRRVQTVRGLTDPAAEARLLRAMEANGTVSFDFYDTLVTRATVVPEDVLAFVGHLLRHEGLDEAGEFARVRLRADAAARIGTDKGDVTLADIYGAFPSDWGPERRQRAMAHELRLERDVLRPRDRTVAMARRAKAAGRRTIVVSDTCMDAAFVRKVLRDHGSAGSFDEIHCSSELLLRKDSGTIWPWLRARLPGRDGGLVHVGDSRHSDVEQPRRAGFAAIGIPNAALTAEMRGFPLPEHWRSQDHDWRSGIVLGPAVARLGSDPFVPVETGRHSFSEPSEFGFAVLGPLLFGFVSWLVRSARRDGVDRLFFLARDGWFLKQVYETCTRSAPFAVPTAAYLEVSRRSTMPPAVHAAFDLDLLLRSKFTGRVSDLVRGRLGIDIGAFVPAERADEIVRLPRDKARLVALLTEHREAIRERLSVGHDVFRRYLGQSGLGDAGGAAALVDFSSSGTIQLALEAVLGRGLTGYYMMISRAFASGGGNAGASAATACFVDASEQWQLQPVQAAAILLEGLLTAPYGQITGYRDGPSGLVEPFGHPDPDSGAGFAAIREAMDGADRYCRELVDTFGGEVLLLDVPKRDLQLPLGAFVRGRLQMPARLREAIAIEDGFGGNGTMAFARPSRAAEPAPPA